MQNNFQAAMDFLSGLDKDWAQLVATVGLCTFESKPEREPYEALVRAVAYQQLHGKAGDAIIKRFLHVYGDVFSCTQSIISN